MNAELNTTQVKKDQKTADAFADSWNNLPLGSVYTMDQFVDWLDPITEADVKGKRMLELGCGNASLLVHAAQWNPSYLEGVDLGASVLSAEKNLGALSFKDWKVTKADLSEYRSGGFDVVYCIGVLHHLKDIKKGLDSVVANTGAGGLFHCWVYAREGNGVIVYIVDPIRKIVSHLPWWFTKYCVALPLVTPYYLYAKLMQAIEKTSLRTIFSTFPLYTYSQWIAKRNFAFFRHVAFDQLVTPQTTYISKKQIEAWLATYPQIKEGSQYIIFRNGNSWKFGAIKS